MQIALNHLINLYNDDGTEIGNMNPSGNLIFDFCFEFVYPINLIYNNGSIITINSNEELIHVLINSTIQLFIVGIEFPFNVEIYNPDTNEIELLTITNENEFANLLINCIFENSCICTAEYDPVCVEIIENNQTIIITFQNACYAECEGFTEEDYFDCDSTSTCDISELEIEVGECNNDGTYPVTINFEYENANGQEYFDLYLRNDELLGYFQLSELPLTIEHFPLSGYENDYIKVCINDNLECCEDIEWLAPDCSPNDCTENLIVSYLIACPWDVNASSEDYIYIFNSDFFFSITLSDNSYSTSGTYSLSTNASGEIVVTMLEELNDFNHEWTFSNCDFSNLQVTSSDPNNNTVEISCSGNDDCYQYVFPIQMILDGSVVNVGNNEHVDYKLDLGYELVYPIELIINNETILVFQGILEGTHGERCD
tara:strand:- start:158 stop:1441 length:1284 start_codon:yes stop_codon:yes gene_type:complete